MKKLASVTLSLNRFGASSRLFPVFLASACSSYMAAVNAHAVENITPFLPGVTIGVPVGALPPPGLYFASANTVFDINVKNDQGQNTGVHVLDPSTPGAAGAGDLATDAASMSATGAERNCRHSFLPAAVGSIPENMCPL
jgi:hypothetical protein